MVLGAACCLRAYVGLRAIHAVAPMPVLKGDQPKWVLTQVDHLMWFSYFGAGLIAAGIVVAVASAMVLTGVGRRLPSTAESA